MFFFLFFFLGGGGILAPAHEHDSLGTGRATNQKIPFHSLSEILGIFSRSFWLNGKRPWLFVYVTHLTLKMASPPVVETSVTNNSPSQDPNHPDHLFQSRNIISVSKREN